MEKRNLEQRVAIKFCAKLGDSATETYAKVFKVFGDDSMSRAQVFRWHKMFKDGRESVEDEARGGRPVEVSVDSHGLVHKEFVPPGQTVNQVFYREVLDRLRKRVNRVRPDIANNWVLHHDNAPSHCAFSVMQFLASKNIPVLPQPPYSPDLSPCDFFLFPKIKNVVKGTHFESIEDIQQTVTRVLLEVPVTDFQNCYNAWKNRWNRCISAEGDYFEGDHVVTE